MPALQRSSTGPMRYRVEYHLAAGKSGRTVDDQVAPIARRQVHQQALGGDEYAVPGFDAVHPAAVQRRLGEFDDAVVAREQLATQRHHRRQVDRIPRNAVEQTGTVQTPEAGLQAFGQGYDGRLWVRTQILRGGRVERQRPPRVILMRLAELLVVIVDRVEKCDGPRVVEHTVRALGLDGAIAQRPQCGGRDAQQRIAVDPRHSAMVATPPANRDRSPTAATVGSLHGTPSVRRQAAGRDQWELYRRARHHQARRASPALERAVLLRPAQSGYPGIDHRAACQDPQLAP